MATTIAQAVGTTTPDDWTLAAGASKAAAVNQPDDDASSYIRSGTTVDTYQYFTCSPGLSAGDVITQIVGVVRARRGGTSDAQFLIGYRFTPQGGGTHSEESGLPSSGYFESTSAWTTFSRAFSVPSVAWGSGLALWVRNTQARRVDVTTFYAEITYTPVATGDGQPMVARARLVPGMRRPHGHQGW
jgi:hypothetical protein